MPVILTNLVTGPEVGDSTETTGADAFTEKDVVAEPVAVVTVTAVSPVRAAKEIWKVAVMEVGVVKTLRTRVPGLSVASAAPVRLVPVMETVTDAPALPVFGVIAVIVGAPPPRCSAQSTVDCRRHHRYTSRHSPARR